MHKTAGSKYNWVYDAMNNWEYVNFNDTLYKQFDIASSKLLNQYTSVNSANYTYDNNGNLTGDGVYTYEYDPENRLWVVKQSGTAVASYNYDARGRRISKTVYPTGQYTKYCYDGDQVIAEYDGSDTLLRKYIYGPGIDEPIAMIVPGETEDTTYFYHQDALGSVVALSKFDSGLGYAQFVEKYSYSAFGETTVTLNGNTGNPYRFTGREYEPETGLYYYRARFYKPEIGRFLQTDPIGYYDSANLYQYCLNNPTNYIDSYGLTITVKGDLKVYEMAKEYLMKSQRGKDTIEFLENHKNEYVIELNNEGKTQFIGGLEWKIQWDPTMSTTYNKGLIFVNKESVSPAFKLVHELEHARNHAEGDAHKSIPDKKIPKGFPNWEEYNVVTGPEKLIAEQLGEAIRDRYLENMFFSYSNTRVKSPTCKGK